MRPFTICAVVFAFGRAAPAAQEQSGRIRSSREFRQLASGGFGVNRGMGSLKILR